MNIQKYSGSLLRLFSPEFKNLIFLKIGGSVLKTLEDIKYAIALVALLKPKLIVLSALYGVTSKLELMAQLLVEEKLIQAEDVWNEIVETHVSYAKHFGVKGVETFFSNQHSFVFGELLDSLHHTDEKSVQSFTNYIMCIGERAAVKLLKPLLWGDGVKVTQIDPEKTIFLASPSKSFAFGEAGIHLDPTLEKLGDEITKAFAHGCKVLLPGFIAKGGNLGRNGSDTTLALASTAYYQKKKKPPRVIFLKEKAFTHRETADGTNFNQCFKKWGFFLRSFRSGEQPYIYPDAVSLMLGSPDHREYPGPGFSLPFQILAKEDPDFNLCIVSCRQHTQAGEEWRATHEVRDLAKERALEAEHAKA